MFNLLIFSIVSLVLGSFCFLAVKEFDAELSSILEIGALKLLKEVPKRKLVGILTFILFNRLELLLLLLPWPCEVFIYSGYSLVSSDYVA